MFMGFQPLSACLQQAVFSKQLAAALTALQKNPDNRPKIKKVSRTD
jgi:hypothetical protein